MGYSGDPSSSNIDAVRFWAQDTGPTELLTDAEIDYLITFSGLDADVAPMDVAALAADRIAAKYAGMETISADGVTYSGAELGHKYRELAAELRKSARTMQGWYAPPLVGGLTAHPRQFALAMHDNPGAGTQPFPWTTDEQLAALVDPETGKVG